MGGKEVLPWCATSLFIVPSVGNMIAVDGAGEQKPLTYCKRRITTILQKRFANVTQFFGLYENHFVEMGKKATEEALLNSKRRLQISASSPVVSIQSAQDGVIWRPIREPAACSSSNEIVLEIVSQLQELFAFRDDITKWKEVTTTLLAAFAKHQTTQANSGENIISSLITLRNEIDGHGSDSQTHEESIRRIEAILMQILPPELAEQLDS